MDVFSDLLNVTSLDDKLTRTFNKFAIQVQDTVPDGQSLSVNLGSVEQALNSSLGFDDKSLITSGVIMNALDISTAVVQIPENFTESILECRSDIISGKQRLSYLVFLTDILFQPQNKSNLSIGSIIVSTRLSCADNSSLLIPIEIIFRTNETVI